MEIQVSWHEIATSGAYALFCIFGWVIRSLWDAVRDLERDLPQNYVRRDDFKDEMVEIKEMLTRIFDKLDNKVDK